MSFKKRNGDQQTQPPPGSRLSAYNGQTLVSTGVPSLDDILGGGMPIGTVLLIKEDRATSYAQLLLKYFLAQGVASGHHCMLASRDEDPEEMLQSLMWLATTDADADNDNETSNSDKVDREDDRMKIAWRYSHLKKFDTASPPPKPSAESRNSTPEKSNIPTPYCSLFDLTKRIPENILKDAHTTLSCSADSPSDNEDSVDHYEVLLKEVHSCVEKGNFSPTSPTPARNVLRVGIHSLASPSWQSKTSNDLYKFFHALRGLLRFTLGAAVVTIPSYLYHESPHFITRVEHAVDGVIGIESFAGSSVHNNAPYTQNYHGFFHVHKVPVLNSLLPPSTKLSVLSAGGSNDLAFKLRRKRFAIETFHLPPEGGVGARRTEPTQTPPEPEPEKKPASKPKSLLSSLAGKRNTPRSIGLGAGCGSSPGQKDPLEF